MPLLGAGGGAVKDGELWSEYTHIVEDSKDLGRLSMHYRRGVHTSLSHLRGTDLVVMVCGTH